MNVIEVAGFGGPEMLRLARRAVPAAGAGEVLIKVAAAGVNRADLMQRRGKYPPPPGASEILGLEVSGVVAAVGDGTQRWKKGDKVCALLAGGGYADYAIVPATHCLPIPDCVPFVQAAALVEAITTVYANLFDGLSLKSAAKLLIHGGSSGIGTTAIQMLKLAGAVVFVTVGSDEKASACLELGADLAINYHNVDFVAAVQNATNGCGVDVVLDMVGGDYVPRNLSILAPGGRHVSIATQSGPHCLIDLRQVMQKRMIVTGSTLRGRDAAEKARLLAAVEAEIWPWVAKGRLKPVIYQSFPLKNAAEAHKLLESGTTIGKIVLEVS